MELDALKAVFAPADVKWRPGAVNRDKTKALALAYIDARAVMDRLDEVVGPANWRDEYRAGPQGGVLCRLSIRWGDEWVAKEDAAENTDVEPVKGGFSDALRRAGVKWGIGRYLYRLPAQWVAVEERGRTVVFVEAPKLPAWALPGGNGGIAQPAEQALRKREVEGSTPSLPSKDERPLRERLDAETGELLPPAAPAQALDDVKATWNALETLRKEAGLTGPDIGAVMGGAYSIVALQAYLEADERHTVGTLVSAAVARKEVR